MSPALRRIIDRGLAKRGLRIEPLPRPDALGASHPDLEPAFAEAYAPCAPFTMTSVERMYALWQAVRHVSLTGVEGDIVECGVWRGGSSMLAALTLQQLGDDGRDLHLFDTFEGMPTPGAQDLDPTGASMLAEWDRHAGRHDDPVFAYGAVEEVRANMATTGLAAERIRLIQGKVEDTIPGAAPDRIAVLRLDTDWYESTRHELEHLWPRLSPGGVLILDDYGHWAGARQAVDEFFLDHGDSPLLHRIDYTGRIGVKAAR
jgi:O-methyltransferase